MSNIESIRAAVYRSLEAATVIHSGAQATIGTDDTVIVGRTAVLDSMDFVNFLVALEEELERGLHQEVKIPELLALLGENGAVTVRSLISVLAERLA